MYPILVSAVSTIASNVIENWISSNASKAAAPAEDFAALLEKDAVIRPSAAASRDTQIGGLRQRLLDSPEVRTLLASADPAKQPTLTLAASGTLTAQIADGRVTTVLLSPESAATARELAALTNPTGAQRETAGQILPASIFKVSV